MEIVEALKKYWLDFINEAASEEWLFIGFFVLLLYLVILIVNKLNPYAVGKSHNNYFTYHYAIIKRIIITLSLILFIVLTMSIFLWHKTTFFKDYHYELLFIIFSLIPAFIILFYFFRLRNASSGIRRVNIIYPAYTHFIKEAQDRKNVKRYNQLKIWPIIPALAFLILLLPVNNSNLFSVVVDTSGSMSKNEAPNKARLNIAKEQILNAFQKVNNRTDIVLTHPQSNNTNNIDKIINTSSSKSLSAKSYITNKSTLWDYLNELTSEGGSPIYEAMWASFLYTNEFLKQNKNEMYANKQFILISDGIENSLPTEELKQHPICEQEYSSTNRYFNQFYDNFYFVDLGNQEGNIYKTMEGCNFKIIKGSVESLSESIIQTIEASQKNINFPIILGIIVTLLIIFIAMLQPLTY